MVQPTDVQVWSFCCRLFPSYIYNHKSLVIQHVIFGTCRFWSEIVQPVLSDTLISKASKGRPGARGAAGDIQYPLFVLEWCSCCCLPMLVFWILNVMLRLLFLSMVTFFLFAIGGIYHNRLKPMFWRKIEILLLRTKLVRFNKIFIHSVVTTTTNESLVFFMPWSQVIW